MLLVIIAFSCIVALKRQRTLQVMIKAIFVLIIIATGLVFVSGVVWMLRGYRSATDFRLSGSWNPFTSGNFPLFGAITLGYLGVNLPLNQGGELSAPHGPPLRKRAISGHILWGGTTCPWYSTLPPPSGCWSGAGTERELLAVRARQHRRDGPGSGCGR